MGNQFALPPPPPKPKRSGQGAQFDPVTTEQRRFAVARHQITQRAPYFGSVLYKLSFMETSQVQTLAITDRLVVFWNHKYTQTLTDDQLATALFHEILHPLKNHSRRGRSISAVPPVIVPFSQWTPEQRSKAKVWNFAGDCEINEDLLQVGMTEIPGWMIPKKFEFPANQPAEVYYGLFKKAMEDQKKDQGDGDPEDGENGSASGPGAPDPSHSEGSSCPCGSGSGNPSPGEPESSGKAPEGQGQGAGEKGQGAGAGQGQAPAGRTEAEVVQIMGDLAGAIEAYAGKNPGRVPGSWVRWARTTVAPAKIPWHQKLSRRCRNITAKIAGDSSYRHDGFSRRQSFVGFGPGKPILPVLRGNKVRIWVLSDVSGSMGEKEGEVTLRETNGVLKTAAAEVTFGAIDAALNSWKPVKKWQEILPLLIGGGGTDFTEFFTKLEETRKEKRPSIVVFLTDGFAAGIPERCPQGVKFIWVLTGSYVREPCSWGECIRVEH